MPLLLGGTMRGWPPSFEGSAGARRLFAARQKSLSQIGSGTRVSLVMTTTDTPLVESSNARIPVDERRAEAVDALVQTLLELLLHQRHSEHSGSESLDGDE